MITVFKYLCSSSQRYATWHVCVCVLGGGGGAHCENGVWEEGGEYMEKEGGKECVCGSWASVTVGGGGGGCCQLFFCNLDVEREGVCVCVRERGTGSIERVCEGEKLRDRVCV